MKKIILTIFILCVCSLAVNCKPDIPDSVQKFCGDKCKYFYVNDVGKYEVYHMVPKIKKGSMHMGLPQFVLYNPKTNKAKWLNPQKKEYDELCKHIMYRGHIMYYPEPLRQQNTD